MITINRKRYLPAIFVCLLNYFCEAQVSQSLRGTVRDAVTQTPVANATVIAAGITSYSSVTDSSGRYSFSAEPGRYSMLVESASHRSVQRANVIVYSAKQTVQDFEPEEIRSELDNVNVRAKTDTDISLDQWNIQQFAAVFYDPARVVNSSASVVNTNDQANHVSVRGTSPNYIQWKVEGVEAVNPNHLENSGTYNDRPALNGGGVSMISAQMLQNSGFQYAPLDPLTGNALSGAFDIRLRNGNTEKHEKTIQVSLLGTDLSMEGPLNKKQSASYLFNFRYSTIGLLSKMGINFGGEVSSYMDLSHALFFSHKYGYIKIFGINGSSETWFSGPRDTADILVEKDLQDINYNSRTTLNGIIFLTNLSNTMFLKSVVAYSTKNVSRVSKLTRDWPGLMNESENFRQEKISSVHYLSKRITQVFSVRAGSHVNYFTNRLQIENDRNHSAEISDPILEPFISFDGTLSKKLEFRAGVHSLYQTRLRYFNLQPRITVSWHLNSEHAIDLKYGASAQMPPNFLYLNTPWNRNLTPTRNISYAVMYNAALRRNKFKAEFYYEQFYSIPVNQARQFSAFNYFNEAIFFGLEQSGQATVYGVDLNYEKHLNSFYLINSLSLFNSTYRIAGKEYTGRFNTRYNNVLTTGKEFTLKKKNNTMNVDLRGMYHPGFRLVDRDDSGYDYREQLPPYFRLDFRFSYKINKIKSSTIWAIDIQNLTNRRNQFYSYFDRYSNRKENVYQLGLIPVLSYKVFF
jgi:hypothetical protein